MPRELAAIELNTFNAGLITDASPLTSPDNSSLDEENMVLNSDGSRNRRLGMDFEEDFQEIATSITYSNPSDISHSVFRWENAGGDSGRNVAVVQFGNELKFFDMATRPISGNLLYTHIFSTLGNDISLSYASVDGVLVVATGEKAIQTFQIDGNIVTQSETTLYIRDLFGVHAEDGGVDLNSGAGLQKRPTTLSTPHLYNLRNQSFGIPRVLETDVTTKQDPLTSFYSTASAYPSNSDSVTQALYADANLSSGRTLERFFTQDLFSNPLGASKTAVGYFIIDALERGASRVAQEAANRTTYPLITHAITPSQLPEDKTPGGASVVAEFSGRAWYAGFSGELVDGDSRSPRMSSYILFSQLVSNISDIGLCYQEGDPTTKDTPELVDTDGGYIRIDGAYGINRIENMSGSLIIMAENGIWRITGTSDSGFTATAYTVEKVSDRGCPNPKSSIVVDNTMFYWAEDGIYHLRLGELGGWEAVNISINKIQNLFEAIPEKDKIKVTGSYDRLQRKVRWLYKIDLDEDTDTMELVLDVLLTGFYSNRLTGVADSIPRVVDIFQSTTYQVALTDEQVTVGGADVTVNGFDVTTTATSRADVERGELSYLVVTSLDGNINYTFCNYTDQDFIDWKSHDGVGVDAYAYMITTYLSGTDFQRGKQVPYVHTHMRKTETGISEDGAGNLIIENPSSCLMQVQWDWSSNNGSGRWSRPYQVYRHRRPYIPSSLPDDYDTGYSTVTTRSRIRGFGKVLAVKIYSEPQKDLHIYGWSVLFNVNNNV